MTVLTLESLARSGKLRGQRVLIRSDLNAPHDEHGNITNEARLLASVAAIQLALEAGAGVLVMSHFGRPTEGEYHSDHSLSIIAVRMSALLGLPVRLVRDYLDGVSVAPGEVVMLENCRFNKGEKKNDPELAARYAALCDVYVNDAFGAAHRAQASIVGVAERAGVACAGPLMAAELEALERALSQARRPMVAVVGGSKVSTKLTVLSSLAQRVDRLIVGGGIANTFLLATGHPVGSSLVEPALIGECEWVLAIMRDKGSELPLPVDVLVAKAFSAEAERRCCAIEEVADDEMILDVGPRTSELYRGALEGAGTIVWNGPLGVFEMPPFAAGTKALALAIADATEAGAFSIAGGGDTVAAIDKVGVEKRVSYVSTGGGAFLEFLEGKKLPAVAALEARAAG